MFYIHFVDDSGVDRIYHKTYADVRDALALAGDIVSGHHRRGLALATQARVCEAGSHPDSDKVVATIERSVA